MHTYSELERAYSAQRARTEVVVLEAVLPVACKVRVPVGEGLERAVYAAVASNSRGQRGTERTEDSHFVVVGVCDQQRRIPALSQDTAPSEAPIVL